MSQWAYFKDSRGRPKAALIEAKPFTDVQVGARVTEIIDMPGLKLRDGQSLDAVTAAALLSECADHLAGALGAADRPDSDSGELYARIQSALGRSK